MNFTHDMHLAFNGHDTDLVLLSGVTQYLEEPFAFLKRLFEQKFDYLIFDRTFFVEGDEQIVVQQVPATIYKATYPCRIFNESTFRHQVEASGWKMIADFKSQYDADSICANGNRVYHKGFFLKRHD